MQSRYGDTCRLRRINSVVTVPTSRTPVAEEGATAPALVGNREVSIAVEEVDALRAHVTCLLELVVVVVEGLAYTPACSLLSGIHDSAARQ